MIWSKPIPAKTHDGTDINMLVIDTEGLGSLEANTQHDCCIFALALLLSSHFIYNSVGTISENAIENLSLVVNLTKYIRVSSSDGGDDDDARAADHSDDLAGVFPKFLWVVRDFTLQV